MRRHLSSVFAAFLGLGLNFSAFGAGSSSDLRRFSCETSEQTLDVVVSTLDSSVFLFFRTDIPSLDSVETRLLHRVSNSIELATMATLQIPHSERCTFKDSVVGDELSGSCSLPEGTLLTFELQSGSYVQVPVFGGYLRIHDTSIGLPGISLNLHLDPQGEVHRGTGAMFPSTSCNIEVK